MMPYDSGPQDAGLYARSFADVYDDWYGDLDDPGLLVASFNVACQPGASVLELGSGTGRLAAPLSEAGFGVIALDISTEMLRRTSTGPAPVTGEMTSLPVRDGSVDAILIAYNTFFNLATPDQQQRCLDECARALRPSGLLVIEAFIADDDQNGFGVSVRRHPTSPSDQLAIITGPDPDNDDLLVGSHVEIGSSTHCRAWRLCYRTPTELDVAAAAAGLRLDARYQNWQHDEFDPNGVRHVSWYKAF